MRPLYRLSASAGDQAFVEGWGDNVLAHVAYDLQTDDPAAAPPSFGLQRCGFHMRNPRRRMKGPGLDLVVTDDQATMVDRRPPPYGYGPFLRLQRLADTSARRRSPKPAARTCRVAVMAPVRPALTTSLS